MLPLKNWKMVQNINDFCNFVVEFGPLLPKSAQMTKFNTPGPVLHPYFATYAKRERGQRSAPPKLVQDSWFFVALSTAQMSRSLKSPTRDLREREPERLLP